MVAGCVSIVKDYDRFNGVKVSLKLILDEIRGRLGNRDRVLVKPNFVSVYNPLCATHVNAVDSLIEFFLENFNISEVLVAEAPAQGSFYRGLINYGYLRLKEKYRGVIEFLDLNSDDIEYVSIYDEEGNLFNIRIAKTLLDKSLFKISICRPKTHDTVVVTLSIKNLAVGAPIREDKPKIHQNYFFINLNIAVLARHVYPDLGVIDGYEGMEGEGPVYGTPKPWRTYFASTNPLHLDSLVAYCMGFNSYDIGYLYILHKWGYGEIDPWKIPVNGASIDSVRTRFKPHNLYRKQLSWKQQLGIYGARFNLV